MRGLCSLSLSLCLELVELIDCIADLLVELSKIVEVSLNLLYWEVDKHTSNLRSPLLTHKLLDVLINEFFYKRFVEGVLVNDCLEVAETLLIVAIN